MFWEINQAEVKDVAWGLGNAPLL